MSKYISPDDFIKSVNGKGFDIDGSYGVQCVDGIKKFALDVYGKADFTCGNGWANGLWLCYDTNGVSKYFKKYPYSEAKKGDWIIWDKNSKDAPNSHVAMFVEKVSSTRVKCFGQNQNGIKEFNKITVNSDGILGVLRPTIYIEQETTKIGTPVSRDTTKDQVEVLVDNLNVRNGANTHAGKLGYINKGIYNYISKTTDDKYTWYQIEDKVFIANDGNWCKEYKKETTDIEKLQSEIQNLQAKVNELEKEKTLLEIDLNSSESELKGYKEYIATKTDDFYITLNENEKLIYKIVKD